MTNRSLSAVALTALGLAVTLAASSRLWARESWPAEPPEHKQKMAALHKLNDAAWEKAKPVVEEWAKKGKPYIPWAAKPSDLPQAAIPAFPGAEGGGMYSFGGRGGKVYVITSLADDGSPGTFRQACEAGGPRIIVFNVAGIIHLTHAIDIMAPYISIEGQTAPGDGVCIAGASTLVDTHDVVIRYMRFRRGGNDVWDRDDALGGDTIGNIIVDHCSCSWGFDENISMYRHIYHSPDGGGDKKLPTVNITLQWNISSEALDTYNHAFGGTWGGFNATFDHNLFANNTGRNASIGMGHDFNWVNNVLYNWRHRTLDGGDETSMVNCINNYYKPGPAANPGPIQFRIGEVTGRQPAKNSPVRLFGKWYASGNVVAGNDKVTANNWAGGIQFSDGTASEDAAPSPNARVTQPSDDAVAASTQKFATLTDKVKMTQPFPMPPVTVQTAEAAYESVLAKGGASLPRRDPVDIRIIKEVRTGTPTYAAGKGIIKDMSDIPGYPEYKGEPVAMTQNDGIPDAWKKKYGLDVNDADLAGKDSSGDGYTNIEKYLYGLDPTKKVNWKDLKNNVNAMGPDAGAAAQ